MVFFPHTRTTNGPWFPFNFSNPALRLEEKLKNNIDKWKQKMHKHLVTCIFWKMYIQHQVATSFLKTIDHHKEHITSNISKSKRGHDSQNSNQSKKNARNITMAIDASLSHQQLNRFTKPLKKLLITKKKKKKTR